MPETECTHEYYVISHKLFCRDCGAGPEVQPGFRPDGGSPPGHGKDDEDDEHGGGNRPPKGKKGKK